MNFNTVDYNREKNALVIIDQTKLPGETVFLEITSRKMLGRLSKV